MAPRVTQGPRYTAPALEKGLDILELLALEAEGLSQRRVAEALNRSSGEIFRMLACLEQRGYLHRGHDERYRLTPKLFRLAHHHPPTHQLLGAALPEMRKLAAAAEQSCHLVIRHEDQGLVLAQTDSPGFMGFAVRVGARIPLADSCSGAVLLAFQDPDTQAAWLRASGLGPRARRTRELQQTLMRIRKRGFEQRASPMMKGITDISRPIRDHSDSAIAALTVPCLPQYGAHPELPKVSRLLADSAAAISEQLGGTS